MAVEPISYSFVYDHVQGKPSQQRRINGWADSLSVGVVTAPSIAARKTFDYEEGYDFRLSWHTRIWIPNDVSMDGRREDYLKDMRRQVAQGFHMEMYGCVLGVLDKLRHELMCGTASRNDLLEQIEDLYRKIKE